MANYAKKKAGNLNGLSTLSPGLSMRKWEGRESPGDENAFDALGRFRL